MVRKVVTPVAITVILFTAVVGAQTMFNDWNRNTGEEALVWATGEDCDLFTGRQTSNGETLLEPATNISKQQLADVLYRFKQRIDDGECEVTDTTTTAAATTTTTLAPITTTTTVPVTTTAVSATENVIWEAVLEPGDVWSGRTVGFREGGAGSLSDTTITYNEVEYTVNILFTFNNSIRIAITDKKPDLRATLLSEIPDGVLSITSVSDPSNTFTGTISSSLLGPNTIDFRWPIENGFALTPGERYQVRLTTPSTVPASGEITTTTEAATTTTTAGTTTTTVPNGDSPSGYLAKNGPLVQLSTLGDYHAEIEITHPGDPAHSGNQYGCTWIDGRNCSPRSRALIGGPPFDVRVRNPIPGVDVKVSWRTALPEDVTYQHTSLLPADDWASYETTLYSCHMAVTWNEKPDFTGTEHTRLLFYSGKGRYQFAPSPISRCTLYVKHTNPEGQTVTSKTPTQNIDWKPRFTIYKQDSGTYRVELLNYKTGYIVEITLDISIPGKAHPTTGRPYFLLNTLYFYGNGTSDIDYLDQLDRAKHLVLDSNIDYRPYIRIRSCRVTHNVAPGALVYESSDSLYPGNTTNENRYCSMGYVR